MASNAEILKEKIIEWGASKVAFANAGDYLPAYFKNLKYAVSIAVRLSDAIIDEIKDAPTHTYFHHYKAVNALIDNITLRASLLIQDWGYLAAAIPASQTVKTSEDLYTGIFQHKTAANLSGLGWIGKSGLLITPEYGPRVRLGTILTDMELPGTEDIHNTDCKGCNICKIACPAMAITGKNWYKGVQRSEIIDAEACSKYMNTNFKHIGRGSVCGICMNVCPHGKNINKRKMERV
ncbi:epoxyqueuosine reductase [Oxobacter pfennigii]|uniref:Epoxyqueuosine reductase n=1 Tax=Oxobacter pfennigii TaxID=36849 RepID=A0A0N8NSJ6_9CLOT|nr:4Fe-4S double cluster binding domain-containing protein [Oxobacter pfennigii]KPU42216.1 epoxyqueuosine reductase [Oxobacter pfennigii]